MTSDGLFTPIFVPAALREAVSDRNLEATNGDYLGSAPVFVERALELYRRESAGRPEEEE